MLETEPNDRNAPTEAGAAGQSGALTETTPAQAEESAGGGRRLLRRARRAVSKAAAAPEASGGAAAVARVNRSSRDMKPAYQFEGRWP